DGLLDALDVLLDARARSTGHDRGGIDAIRGKIGVLAAQIREVIERMPIPKEIVESVAGMLRRQGEWDGCAVRSSATAEDLPTASFAGQHDTYLNVVGPDAILQHVSRAWASMFTDQAVTYRLRNGFDHSKVEMAVVVQQMVFPHAAGVLFTADPVTS